MIWCVVSEHVLRMRLVVHVGRAMVSICQPLSVVCLLVGLLLLLLFRKSAKAGETSGSSSDNVQVVVRCRPLNEAEVKDGHKQAVHVDHTRGTVTIDLSKKKYADGSQKTYTFDTVFGPEAKQVDVYNLTARRIVNSVLEGYNGETGSSSPACSITLRICQDITSYRGFRENSSL